MRESRWLALVIFLLAVGRGMAEDHPCGAESPGGGCLQRIHPAGGWFPYGGGLLHWWNPDCFPNCGGPDDYCRKSLPNVCRPKYPPFYTYGPPEICGPSCHKLPDGCQSHGPQTTMHESARYEPEVSAMSGERFEHVWTSRVR
jgi:hypothetical protein